VPKVVQPQPRSSLALAIRRHGHAARPAVVRVRVGVRRLGVRKMAEEHDAAQEAYEDQERQECEPMFHG
jgi:hypothetical protein